MINVEYCPYLLNIADISALHKTAKNLLNIVIQEINYAMDVLKINLIVGDIFKVKGAFVQCMEGAIEVIKWFNNHSRAHGMLNDVQRQKLLKVLALILPVLTRWTSHYLAIRRLLELEIAFKQLLLDSKPVILTCAGEKREAKEKAMEIMGILEGYNFWNLLKWIKDHLEPLAIAANVTQSDNTRLDVILVTLVNLYQIFSDSSRRFDPTIATAVLASLEKRWANADRPIFLLAMILNPYICATFFAKESPYQTFVKLWALVSNTYKCLFRTDDEPDHDFCTAFNCYLNQVGEWSDEAMGLKYHKDVAVKETMFKERGVNLISLWHELNPSLGDEPSDPLGPPRGKIALVELAMRIHISLGSSTPSIVTVHPEKIRKEVLLKINTMARFGHLPRCKRMFGEEDDDDIESSPGMLQPLDRSSTSTLPDLRASDPLHFGCITREMIDNASNKGFTPPVASVHASPVPSQPLPSNRSNHDSLSIQNLFYFPAASDSTSTSSQILMEFWANGERGFLNEISFHDSLYRSTNTD
ncbi:hypothetical protein H0H92_006199 [Tricholoma furcatifolium]|nr:hypothetical protein H0H92_006199 [Tricholoma furcatifolium]